MRRLAPVLALPVMLWLSACGEHPCTLHIGEPTWCAELDDASPEFCAEICEVCSGQPDEASACRAHCREVAGLDQRSCAEISTEDEDAYRRCVAEEDYIGCGGYEGYLEHELGL